VSKYGKGKKGLEFGRGPRRVEMLGGGKNTKVEVSATGNLITKERREKQILQAQQLGEFKRGCILGKEPSHVPRKGSMGRSERVRESLTIKTSASRTRKGGKKKRGRLDSRGSLRKQRGCEVKSWGTLGIAIKPRSQTQYNYALFKRVGE